MAYVTKVTVVTVMVVGVVRDYLSNDGDDDSDGEKGVVLAKVMMGDGEVPDGFGNWTDGGDNGVLHTGYCSGVNSVFICIVCWSKCPYK